MYRKEKNHAGMDGLIFLHHELCQYKWYSIVLPLVACISQISQSIILIVLPKMVLDAVTNNYELEVLMQKIIILGTALIITTFLNLIIHNEIEKCSQTFLFRRLYPIWQRKAMRLDYNTYISGQGKLKMEKARNVISSPNWGVVELLSKEAALLEALVGLFVYCAIVGSLQPIIILFLLVFFLVELICGIKIEREKQDFKEERARADRRLNYIAYGTRGMQEAKDIRIFSMTAMLKEITQQVILAKSQVETKVQNRQFIHLAISAAMILIRDSITYLFLINRYLTRDMSIGDFTFYFAAITGIGMWLTKLSDAISGYKENMYSVRDFYEFIALPEEDNGKVSQLSVEAPVSVELRNVFYSYSNASKEAEEEQIPILENFQLRVEPGEKIAIVGTNGAGKSTLIKILCGLLTPEKGEVLLGGIDSRRLSRADYYKLFAAVFQKSQLLPVSIADNICLQADGNIDKARMWECIRQAGLEEKIKALPDKEATCLLKQVSEDGTQLSGGQEQRLLLARAIYKNAPILILDEPTAALDPISESQIYQKYNELTKGKTSFFVSHRLASTRFCDRILFMEDGKIVEMGTHEELMKKNGKYADMFRVQSKYYQEEEKEWREAE